MQLNHPSVVDLAGVVYAETGAWQAPIALVDEIGNHGHVESGQPVALGYQQEDQHEDVQCYLGDNPEV